MVRRPVAAFSQVFVNQDAEKLYKHFVHAAQPTHVVCDFAPEPSDGNLVDQIHQLDWPRLCDQPCTANVVAVWEFYANAHYNRPGNVVLARGKDVSFSSATIKSILNLPTVENDDFHRLLHEGANYEAFLQEMVQGSHWTYSVSNPTKPLHV